MSVEIVKSEIKRFLASSAPEVLCIKGKWGVGKTFAWRQFLGEAENEGTLGLKQYAYVSLFGLNDLEALRYSIFENTVSTGDFLSTADVASFGYMLDRVKGLTRKGRPFYAAVANKFGGNGAGDALSRAAFLAVRNQYVCLDDLERSGDSLRIRDVLGLASMLKEQRRCKVILLLNEERLDDADKDELQRQLEKVVDVSLVFEPSPEEAVDIAFAAKTPLNDKLAPRIVKLGVTNIRIIKKIERLAERLAKLLSPYRSEVLDQGIHAVALGGLSVLQPDSAPPIDFVRKHNSLLAAMREKKDDLPDEVRQWTDYIEEYGWSHSDDLDNAIFDGVLAGYFNEDTILHAANEVQSNYDNSKENSPFSKAWRLYHDSFLIDDDKVLDALYLGAKESLSTVTPMNLNGTIMLLRECERDVQADELIKLYMAQPELNTNQLDEELQMWGDEPIDPTLASAFEKLKADFVDTRDPKDVLIAMVTNRGWNEADLALLAKQSANEFEKMFESIEGRNLSSVVKYALSLGAYDGENHKKVGKSVTAALKSIAAKSPLRKRRIAGFGVKFD